MLLLDFGVELVLQQVALHHVVPRLSGRLKQAKMLKLHGVAESTSPRTSDCDTALLKRVCARRARDLARVVLVVIVERQLAYRRAAAHYRFAQIRRDHQFVRAQSCWCAGTGAHTDEARQRVALGRLSPSCRALARRHRFTEGVIGQVVRAFVHGVRAAAARLHLAGVHAH